MANSSSSSKKPPAETKWPVLGRLKRTVKKIQFLLNFNISSWRLASLLGGAFSDSKIQRLSFNDRVGLQSCIDDELDRQFADSPTTPERVYQRTTSYVSASSSDDDVDRRAEIFISNFYRQLQLERQISLELRYCRGRGGSSFDKTSSFASSSSPTS